MKYQLPGQRLILFLTLMTLAPLLRANVNLPAIFADNMVMQQNSSVKIWGWAKPNENVTVKVGWSTETFTYKTDNQAHWEVTVSTPPAGGPYDIEIEGYNKVMIRNVMLGEVWLCSGQSNMEWSLAGGVIGAEKAMANAQNPNIRFFTVAHRTATTPQIDLEGAWAVSTPENSRSFSAVAYFFAAKIQQELGVPVGIIHSSWGGTPAETWIPENKIRQDPALSAAADRLEPVPWGPVEPARAYNAMIDPLTTFPIAGVLWYQGEANTINAESYEDMFATLIRSWRELWGQEFPFYYAQIAPFRYGAGNRGTLVRDAQRRVLKLPQTGMVVTSDIGDTTDIHPRNKLDVGQRLANLALSRHYRVSDAVAAGPLFKNMEIDGRKVWINFENDEGLHATEKEITHFELAGADGVFYPAKAFFRKGRLVLLSKQVRHPKRVRYAWSNTATPNLFNGTGLPTSSFISE
ncbi:sialate O-acetylesterase [Flavilitoribacter nigricans]|uniref:Sialate O-acetylesterase n=1 Tax=Flavilitoribacter nigricans (strain ATCC 23147 / DSM 23189 / NBRC 102662 / NCIMB 1420 / SS-2) TaxID=1122177 RepID=A0A2D0MY98_FLAN2|nr:sialate O-acetylesterase [Flavilitoribacter nigricans]PHN00859.1 sialate O-acetylesterase [Flavilitoribacter nigricans DSM 23189 = NBRC 102662]